MTYLYFILLVCSLSFPLAWSFESKVQYAKKWKALFPSIVITLVFFTIWDSIFTSLGVWGFNDNYLIGFRYFELPLEEWLFFIIIPFSSVFIYECVQAYIGDIKHTKTLIRISYLISILLLVIAIINSDRLYTFWNFVFTAIFLGVITFRNPDWFGKFWLAYLFHLIPFFIVNGVLTGSFIEEPIVWYNNEENLSIRLFTIPIEDSIYALLLLLMNVTLFEYFKKRILQTTSR